ncbi:hypothetical protein [Rubellimicrobium arenae]|uniref:hypothetical protein n=1 Tax=Rubellimicrobium arenae TaxID=2817372 RepID=UPI001B305F75|nr:hypothetical protein [Rubellimicrobium arenae]
MDHDALVDVRVPRTEYAMFIEHATPLGSHSLTSRTSMERDVDVEIAHLEPTLPVVRVGPACSTSRT